MTVWKNIFWTVSAGWRDEFIWSALMLDEQPRHEEGPTKVVWETVVAQEAKAGDQTVINGIMS